jgi:hypothetical protein
MLVLRGIGLWVAVRVLLAVAMWMASASLASAGSPLRDAVRPGPLDGAMAVAAVALLAWLDARRRGETVLLANLAAWPAAGAGLALAAAIPLEAALLLAVAAW